MSIVLLLGKLRSCARRRRQLKKKFFKKGNMVNQYMRVRLEEIEEQAETIVLTHLFYLDMIDIVFQLFCKP